MDPLIGPLDMRWLATFCASGDYTPTYQGGTSGGSTTYTIQQGAWTRLGNMVFVTGTVAWTAASGTGDARISLPFVVANVANQNFTGSLRLSGITFANGSPEVLILPNTQYFIMQSPLTNASPTTVAVEAAATVVFNVAYRVEE
mgnify:CR=1 FL=1